MKKCRLIVDVALCQGCHNCLLACRDEHAGNNWPGYTGPQALAGEKWISVPCRERGQYPLVDVVYRPTFCTHCSDAPCVDRSEGAIRRRPDGIVLMDPVKAAGRRYLVKACPYGMISWSEESSSAQKCTLCAHLLDDGWAKPRCVQACGPGALTFAREDDEVFAARVEAEGLQSLYGGPPVDTVVCYKNLHRYESCFVGGSVAVDRDGIVDCVSGSTVTLVKEEGPSHGEALMTTVTDAFGDFKFDGLEPESGVYLVRVLSGDGRVVERTAVLGRSVNVGTVLVEGER